MAGGGSSEIQELREVLLRKELRLSQAEFALETLRNQVADLEGLVAGLQSAVRGGDVPAAAGVRCAARAAADGGSVGVVAARKRGR